MKDENIVKTLTWLFKKETTVNLSGVLTLYFAGEPTKWHVRLKKDLLGMKPVDQTTAKPMLFSCKKIRVERSADDQRSFVVKAEGNTEMKFQAGTEEELLKWVTEIGSWFNQKPSQKHNQKSVQSLYGEPSVKNMNIKDSKDEEAPDSSSLKRLFFTVPFSKPHTFSLPRRNIVGEEVMYESKLSMVLPAELARTFRRFAVNLRDEIKDKFCSMGTAHLLQSHMNILFCLNSNMEKYTQMIDFLDGYVGPAFKPSKEKHNFIFSVVPTNLHVQCLKAEDFSWSCITCGAVAATSLNSRGHGGLYRIKKSLNSNPDQNGLKYSLETRFHTGRGTLKNARSMLDILSRNVNKRNDDQSGAIDKAELLSEVTRLHQLLVNLIESFPDVHNLVDSLTPNGLAKMKKPLVSKPLSKQLDSLESALISLKTQTGTSCSGFKDGQAQSGQAQSGQAQSGQAQSGQAQSGQAQSGQAQSGQAQSGQAQSGQAQSGQKSFEKNTKSSSLNTVLDMLRDLIDSLYHAQSMEMIVGLKTEADSQGCFNLQLRHDIVLAQAITIVSTCLLNNIEQSTKQELESWNRYGPFVSFFGLLSCYGEELGMIEDTRGIWSMFHDLVRFCFTRHNSSTSKICIPSIGGHPADIEVTIPLPEEALQKLPTKYSNGEWFRVKAIYWNIGVNAGPTPETVAFEKDINMAALYAMSDMVFSTEDNPSETLINMFNDLSSTVEKCPSRNNIVTIFTKVQALSREMNGSLIVSCKSGKDRSSMAATWGEGNALKQHFGFSQQQMTEIIDSLRRDGVRLEICRKNVGVARYAVRQKHIDSMPKEFIPPQDTYSKRLAT